MLEGKGGFRPRKGREHVLVNVGGHCIRADEVTGYVEDPAFQEYLAVFSAWNVLEVAPYGSGFLEWPLDDYMVLTAMKAEAAAWEKAKIDDRP